MKEKEIEDKKRKDFKKAFLKDFRKEFENPIKLNVKIKTLKDMETFELSNGGTNEKIVYSKDLKQEAIKDIKELQNFHAFNGSEFPVIVSEYITNPKEIIAYIKWKNNLTEENLK